MRTAEVRAGAAFELAGVRVLAGGVAGGIGQAIPVPPGLIAVAIEVPIRGERVAADARIDLAVPVTSGRTTEIELPAARILRGCSPLWVRARQPYGVPSVLPVEHVHYGGCMR